MRSPAYNAIVKCKGIYDYFVRTGSLKLWVDPLFKKGTRKITYGIVQSPPESIPDDERISICIRKGDKVYFHYNSLDDDSMIPETKGLFLIPMDMMFAYVRRGKLTPIDGKILCTPYFEEDIKEIEVDGKLIRVKMTPEGIVTELNVKHSLKRAVVAHIGNPLRDAPRLDLKRGDHVYYATDGDFENTIEGEKYFVMDQDLILARE